MFAPHTVTLYNAAPAAFGAPPVFSITLLQGVFLDAGLGRNTLGKKSGLLPLGISVNEDAALFIPFDCHAVNALSGQSQRFVPPKIFDSLQDQSGVWTVGLRGRGSAADCFFIKDSVIQPDLDFLGLCRKFDGVFRVSSVLVRDFGSVQMRHWRVGGCAGL